MGRSLGTIQSVLVLTALLACRKGSSSEYFTSGCIVAGEKVAAFGGSQSARIDLETGAVLERRTESKSELSCLADGSVVEIGALSLRVDPEPGEAAASVSRSSSDLTCDRLLASARAGPERNIALEPTLFPELGAANCARLNVLPVRVLADGRVLVAAGVLAGGSPPTLGAVGFYGIELATGDARLLGSTFGSGELRIYDAVAFGATRDGSLVVGVYHLGYPAKDHAELRVMAHRGDTRTELVTISDMRETRGIAVSPSGRFAAVRLTSPKGDFGRVDVIDVEGARVAFSVPCAGTAAHAGFLTDDSVIVASSARQVERRAKDGGLLWRVDLHGSP